MFILPYLNDYSFFMAFYVCLFVLKGIHTSASIAIMTYTTPFYVCVCSQIDISWRGRMHLK